MIFSVVLSLIWVVSSYTGTNKHSGWRLKANPLQLFQAHSCSPSLSLSSLFYSSLQTLESSVYLDHHISLLKSLISLGLAWCCLRCAVTCKFSPGRKQGQYQSWFWFFFFFFHIIGGWLPLFGSHSLKTIGLLWFLLFLNKRLDFIPEISS